MSLNNLWCFNNELGKENTFEIQQESDNQGNNCIYPNICVLLKIPSIVTSTTPFSKPPITCNSWALGQKYENEHYKCGNFSRSCKESQVETPGYWTFQSFLHFNQSSKLRFLFFLHFISLWCSFKQINIFLTLFPFLFLLFLFLFLHKFLLTFFALFIFHF